MRLGLNTVEFIDQGDATLEDRVSLLRGSRKEERTDIS